MDKAESTRTYSKTGLQRIVSSGAQAGLAVGAAVVGTADVVAPDQLQTLVFETIDHVPLLAQLHHFAQPDDLTSTFTCAAITLLVPIMVFVKAGATAGLGAYAAYGDKASAAVILAKEKFFTKNEIGIGIARVGMMLVSPLMSLQGTDSLNDRNFTDASGIEFCGPTSIAFRQALRKAVEAIDPTVMHYMCGQEGWRIVGSSTPFEAHRGYACDAETQALIKSGWHSGVLGWCWHEHLQITVHEHVLNSTRADPATRAVDAGGLVTHLWTRLSPEEVPHIYWHELGHAIDYTFCVSHSPFFVAQFEKDLAAMGGKDTAITKGYSYYVNQPDPGGSYEETFAEIFACLMRQRVTGQELLMLQDFPATAKWIGHFVDELERSCKIGKHEVDALKDYFSLEDPPTEREQPAPVSENVPPQLKL